MYSNFKYYYGFNEVLVFLNFSSFEHPFGLHSPLRRSLVGWGLWCQRHSGAVQILCRIKADPHIFIFSFVVLLLQPSLRKQDKVL